MMQRFLTVIFILLLLHIMPLIANAQDVIVKKDGTTILSKVLEVNQDNVKYKKHSNPNGPTYTVGIADIMAVNYANGEKDTFDTNISNSDSQSANNSSVSRLIEKKPDARNAEIINMYKKIYHPSKYIKRGNSEVKNFYIIYGLKNTSIVSTEDIEMVFIRNRARFKGVGQYIYYTIKLTNKTDRTIYIDRGNCFRVDHKGNSYCYYDPSYQKTIGDGGSNGVSIGLGSIAGALGVGGIAGQLAGGVGVASNKGHFVSTTYLGQRVISIPPHASCNLTDEKWGNLGTGIFGGAPEKLEDAEDFEYSYHYDRKSATYRSIEFGIKKGLVTSGQIYVANGESEFPWTRKYYITYSFEETFETYSSLFADMYIHEIIGSNKNNFANSGNSPKKDDKHIEGLNEHTIEGYHQLCE